MAKKEGMVSQSVDLSGAIIEVNLDLDNDEVAIGGVLSDGTRILYKTIDDGTGKGLFPVVGVPGTSITTAADTAIPAGPATPLPTAPAGTRRVTVQNVSASALTEIRVKEVGGVGGIVLARLGSTSFGGADGAIADLEADLFSGPAGAIAVTFEG